MPEPPDTSDVEETEPLNNASNDPMSVVFSLGQRTCYHGLRAGPRVRCMH